MLVQVLCYPALTVSIFSIFLDSHASIVTHLDTCFRLLWCISTFIHTNDK